MLLTITANRKAALLAVRVVMIYIRTAIVAGLGLPLSLVAGLLGAPFPVVIGLLVVGLIAVLGALIFGIITYVL